LKLLKTGEQKAGADSKKRQVPTGSTTTQGDVSTEHSMTSLKNDLAGALDSIIRQQRAGQTDQGLKNKKKPQVPLKKVLMQEKGGSTEDALLRIAQMLDIQDNNEDGSAETSGMVSAKDDLFIEKENRDEDLAELAYWSDDDKAPRAIHHASAHKVGHLPFKTCAPREYVTQKLGSDLDRNVAMLLLHLRRLNDRHRTFEPETPPRRRFVVGIKEVFRGVRHGRVKCIIVAPDIEEMSTAGGLDEKVKDILRVGYEQDVPVIFALSRVRIGRALGKSLRMSVLAVLDTFGVQDLYESTIDLAFQKRVAWLNEQPKSPPEGMKEESKGKSTNKAREVTAAKDRAVGNNQTKGRQEVSSPPGKWLPKQS
jgi:ribosomal protein L7Ae-like RNA K-turn-binding protein